jgi:glutamate synthase (ferredoxin)
MVSIEALTNEEDIERLHSMISEHAKATGSERAKVILADFEEYIPQFKKVIPLDYARMLDAIREFSKTEPDIESAELKAFQSVTGSGR